MATIQNNLFGKTITKGKTAGDIGRAKMSQMTEFVRASPILSAAAVGSVVGGGLLIAQHIKKRKPPKKRKTITKRKKRKGKSRRNILNKWEIKHAGRGTKGVKLVKFRTAGGKLVTFRRKGTSKRRKGYTGKKRKRGKK